MPGGPSPQPPRKKRAPQKPHYQAPQERMAVLHEKPKKMKKERMAVLINGRTRILD